MDVASKPITTSLSRIASSADTIFSDISLAPPRLFCTEKLLCLLPSGFIRKVTLFLLLTSMPTNSGFMIFTSPVLGFQASRL